MAFQGATPDPILDIEGTLARFGGDKQLFIEMFGILLDDAPRLMGELRSAVAAKNAADVRARAHAVRGLLAGCGGVRAARVAQLLEDAGNSSNLSRSEPLLDELVGEFEELSRALHQYRA
jgi:HPt (histidine-containing phosphotransfer) domain-containing protein